MLYIAGFLRELPCRGRVLFLFVPVTSSCKSAVLSIFLSVNSIHVNERGNRIDTLTKYYGRNFSMKNFFGTPKSECLYRAHYSSRQQVDQLIARYIHLHNYNRINKDGLTPVETRSKAA